MPAQVTIYTTSWCSFCRRAKRLLTEKDAAFTEIDVEERADLRSFLVSASGQSTVPQVFINGESIGGYTELAALEQRGDLDRLLAAPPPAHMPALPT